jgi:hypothetical protein
MLILMLMLMLMLTLLMMMMPMTDPDLQSHPHHLLDPDCYLRYGAGRAEARPKRERIRERKQVGDESFLWYRAHRSSRSRA